MGRCVMERCVLDQTQPLCSGSHGSSRYLPMTKPVRSVFIPKGSTDWTQLQK